MNLIFENLRKTQMAQEDKIVALLGDLDTIATEIWNLRIGAEKCDTSGKPQEVPVRSWDPTLISLNDRRFSTTNIGVSYTSYEEEHDNYQLRSARPEPAANISSDYDYFNMPLLGDDSDVPPLEDDSEWSTSEPGDP